MFISYYVPHLGSVKYKIYLQNVVERYFALQPKFAVISRTVISVKVYNIPLHAIRQESMQNSICVISKIT